MKKMLFSFLVLFLAVALIGACPPPKCKYLNDCNTWHVTATADPGVGTIHLAGTVVVGDPSTAAKSGEFMVVLDGDFTCGTCGKDDTTYTGTLIQRVFLPLGTTKIDLTFQADTTVPHDVVLYLAQTGCSNCAQTLKLHVNWYYVQPKPIWLQLWISTEPVFNIGVVPGPDNGCFVYDLSGDIIPTSTAMKICSAAPDAKAQLVYSGWVTLPYPGTLQCWSSYKDASKCDHEGDILLAKINAEHGWHLAFAWFFPGYPK